MSTAAAVVLFIGVLAYAIFGGADFGVIELNEKALAMLTCEKRLEIIAGATHLFEEPGTLDAAAHLAGSWFAARLGNGHAH